jgi:pSer/pThr/pTyr-binding forkhead associated (FHA) protein
LEATQGAAIGRTIAVRDGQTIQVGRSNWADLSVPEDAELSPVHFELQCDWKECRIRDLQSASGTVVNDAKITAAPLRTGDRVVAGATTFTVRIEGQQVDSGGQDAAGEETTPAVTPANVYCQGLELSEEAEQLLQAGLSPDAYLDLLIAGELFPDAICFLASWLPKPVAVAWGCRCVQSVLGESLKPADQAALDAAAAWAEEPEEPRRRTAEAAANACKFDGPAACLALAAFWSGGSLAPENLDPIPPPGTATAKAVTGALMMAAPHAAPTQAPQRYRKFLDEGRQLVAPR